VVLGRTRNFVAAFNDLLRQNGAVQKLYRALTCTRPPLGLPATALSVTGMLMQLRCKAPVLHGEQTRPGMTAGVMVHHVTVGKRMKGLPAHTEIHSTPREGSQRCELEVLDVELVQVGPSGRVMGFPPSAYQSLIALKTGRTHQVPLHMHADTVSTPARMRFEPTCQCVSVLVTSEECLRVSIVISCTPRMGPCWVRIDEQPCKMQIRAQLAAMGCPILGDTMYEPLARAKRTMCPLSDIPAKTPTLVRPGSLGMSQGVMPVAQDESCTADIQPCHAATVERPLNEPGEYGIGLQACRLEVHADSGLMGHSPAIFEAPFPWWYR
jgi:hypothetical protein